MNKAGLIVLTAGLVVPRVFGISETHLFSKLNLAIPDGSAIGQFNSQIIDSPFDSIATLKVSLDIEGDFNGDLYAILSHESGAYSVLLNRVGRTSANPFGSTDHGLNVTFEDAAADIHTASPSPAGLTGTWSPDARKTDPGSTLDSDPRTAFLSAFQGIDPDGEWTLFLADLEPLGTSTLVSWGLEFEPTHISTVPDSGSTVCLLVFGLAGVVLTRRPSPTRHHPLS